MLMSSLKSLSRTFLVVGLVATTGFWMQQASASASRKPEATRSTATDPGADLNTLPSELSPWNCPAAIDGNPDKIGEAISRELAKGKDGLPGAYELATDCAAFGSSIDVSLLAPVLDAMESALAKTKMSPQARRQMSDMIKVCEKKGEREGGSLGRSFGMNCRAAVVRGFYAAFHD